MDLAAAATTPWSPDEPHTRLATWTGRWAGTMRLWLDPAVPPEEAAIALEATPVLGGRLLRLQYTSTATGKPHAGEYLLGWDQNERRWMAAWIDSFHNGTGVMLSVGEAGDAGIARLLGSYQAGVERWGWRTAFRPEGPDRLVIEATNLWPSGREDRAFEAVLSRVG